MATDETVIVELRVNAEGVTEPLRELRLRPRQQGSEQALVDEIGVTDAGAVELARTVAGLTEASQQLLPARGKLLDALNQAVFAQEDFTPRIHGYGTRHH